MQQCRVQGRGSRRRREGSGFDVRRLRVVETPISWPSELASDQPARDISTITSNHLPIDVGAPLVAGEGCAGLLSVEGGNAVIPSWARGERS
jgi:hypothetical protein